MRRITSLAILSASTLSAPLLAQSQPAPQQDAAAKKPRDPNEMVCEKQAIPGSRLAFAKVCHTRAEWADLRGQDRMDLDRVQTQRGGAADH